MGVSLQLFLFWKCDIYACLLELDLLVLVWWIRISSTATGKFSLRLIGFCYVLVQLLTKLQVSECQ